MIRKLIGRGEGINPRVSKSLFLRLSLIASCLISDLRVEPMMNNNTLSDFDYVTPVDSQRRYILLAVNEDYITPAGKASGRYLD